MPANKGYDPRTRVHTIQQPLSPIDLIRLQLAYRGLTLSHAQIHTLEVLDAACPRLDLRFISQSPCDGHARFNVEVGLRTYVSVNDDGGCSWADPGEGA